MAETLIARERLSNQKSGEDTQRFKTASGIPVKEIYGPEDIDNLDYMRDLNDSGQYPFTRGRYQGMFRNRRWGQRVLTGFGTPADTRERVKYVLQMVIPIH